jgi:hypothetical protein
MKVYVSYAPADEAFADELARRLKSNGVNVWLDMHDAPQDDETTFEAAVAEAFDEADVLLAILNHQAMHDDVVIEEWHRAIDKRYAIIAACSEPCEPPTPIRRIVDFTGEPEGAYHRLMHLLIELNQQFASDRKF